MQEFWLTIAGAGQRIDLRIDMAIDDKQVEPRIVVEINEARSPSDIRPRNLSNLGRHRDVAEIVVAIIAVESIVFVNEICNEDPKAAGVKVIAHRNSHRSLL